MSSLLNPFWSQSAGQPLERLASNKWLRLAATAAAFALLAYGVVQWTVRLQTSSVPIADLHAPNNAAQPSINVEPVLSAHFFGQVDMSAVSMDPMQLPISSLNLVLTGVMARGPSSFAFLSVNGAPEVFITIGEEITTGTTLETVYPDRVVLKRGATLESVLLKGNDIALPPGSIEGPGAEKIIGAVRPQQGGGAPPATATFDDVEPGRDVQLEEAPPEPAHIRNIPRPRTPGSMRR